MSQITPSANYWTGYSNWRVAPKDSIPGSIVQDHQGVYTIKQMMNGQLCDIEPFRQYTFTHGYNTKQFRCEFPAATTIGDLHNINFFSLRYGYARKVQHKMAYYDWAGAAYIQRSLPMISGVLTNTIGTAGGLLFRITGATFIANQASDIVVSIDGVSCPVQTYSTSEIVCLTGSKAGASVVTGAYKGGQGLKRCSYSENNMNNLISKYDAGTLGAPLRACSRMTEPITESNLPSHTGTIVTGFFCPPATGRYKFYTANGYRFVMRQSNTTMDMTAANMNKILDYDWSTWYRFYWRYSHQRSNWTSMTAGECYFTEMFH